MRALLLMLRVAETLWRGGGVCLPAGPPDYASRPLGVSRTKRSLALFARNQLVDACDGLLIGH